MPQRTPEEMIKYWREVQLEIDKKIKELAKTMDDLHLKYDDLVHETDKAYLFRFNETEVWLPKSQVDCDQLGTVVVPEWLACESEIEMYAEN